MKLIKRFITPDEQGWVCQFIESREVKAPAEPRMLIDNRQTKRLRTSVAIPTTDNTSALC